MISFTKSFLLELVGFKVLVISFLNFLKNSYKETNNKLWFFIKIFICYLIAIIYISYSFILVFTFIFIWFILLIYIVYFKKKELSVFYFFLYNKECKNQFLSFLKFYFYDLQVLYSFNFFYNFTKVITIKHNINTSFHIIKILLSKSIYIIWILLTGLPLFIFNIIMKLYTRISNLQPKEFSFDINILKINFSSMLLLDFSNLIYIEKNKIYIKDNLLILNMKPNKIVDKIAKTIDEISKSEIVKNNIESAKTLKDKIIFKNVFNKKNHLTKILPIGKSEANNNKTKFEGLQKNLTSKNNLIINNQHQQNHTQYNYKDYSTYETQYVYNTDINDILKNDDNLLLNKTDMRKIIFENNITHNFIDDLTTQKQQDVFVKEEDQINLIKLDSKKFFLDEIINIRKKKNLIISDEVKNFVESNNTLLKELSPEDVDTFNELNTLMTVSQQKNLIFYKNKSLIKLVDYNNLDKDDLNLLEEKINKLTDVLNKLK